MNRFSTSGAVRKVLTVTLVLTLCAGIAVAQRIDGTLRGTVTDTSGAVVSGAQVTATNQATGVSQTTTTTSAGSYEFPNLLVGPYTVTVENSGFQKYVRKDVDVRSNQVTEASARMAVGTTDTTVEVVAGADVVQTTDSQLANTFTASQIVNLPVPNVLGTNGVLNLAILAPNTTTLGGGVLGDGGSIGGARPRMNNFTVDGLDDNRVDITGASSNVVADAVAEFTLITNQFSAEYGHSAGGQFNVVTKGGTNNWHGSLFHLNQNKNYNAFDNIEKLAQGCDTDPNCEKARNDFNQAGGSVGGPIIKNRAFIFGAYQKVWAGFPGTSTIVTAPTDAGIQAMRGIAANSAVTSILDEFVAAPGNDAGSVSVLNRQTGATANVPLGNVAFLAPSFFDERDYHINGDLVFTSHQVHTRYLNNHQVQPNLSDPPIAKFSGDRGVDVHKATITDVWTVTPRFVNDLRFGFTRYTNFFGVPSQYGNFPNLFIESLTNFQLGPEGNSPQSTIQNVYQAVDQMSYATGPHSLKWGYEYRRWIAPGNFLPRGRGEWRYTDLSEFISDQVPQPFAKRGAGSSGTDGNMTAHFGFFQDDWKVTPRLTLNLGLRYEWYGIPNMARTQTLNSIADCPECGAADLIFRLPTTDKNNFAPRVGFAWDLFGDGKTAVRGGFGISYDVIPQNFPSLQLPPQLQTEQDPDITCALPGAPAWCSGPNGWASGGLGFGFLAGDGLLQVNVPPATAADARAATQGIIRDQIMPRVTTWTLSLQREVFRNSSVELRYLGTRGMKLPIQRHVNARSAFDNGAQALPTFFSAGEIPASFAGAPTLDQFFNAVGRPLDPFGFVGAVTAFEPAGDSIYHSGSVDFIHRMTRGLYFRGNYTWAHAIDNGTNELFSSLVNPRRAEDVNHIETERGRSVLDIRHKAALSWVYEVPNAPIENGIARAVLNGWQLNGSYVIQTGQPVTPLSFLDSNGNLDAAGDRAIRNAAGDPSRGSSASTVCWNGAAVSFGCDADAVPDQVVGYVADDPTAGYVQAQPGTRTNVGRNSLESPGRNNVDLSVFKNFKFTESKNLQFRAEFLNVLNHRQYTFANPGVFAVQGIDDSSINAAGYVDPADPLFQNEKQLNGGSRTLTLGLKFIF